MDELEHNNTEDSKELILQQASMEAMCCIDLQMRECWSSEIVPQLTERLCVIFMMLGFFLFRFVKTINIFPKQLTAVC